MLLSLGEIVERFAYFGLFTILVLKLHYIFKDSDQTAFTVFAVFTALSYSALVLGGYITDRYLSPYQAIVLGGILLTVGNLLLASNMHNTFLLGMAFSIMGTAMFKVNSTTLVGKLNYPTNDIKERAYTIFYSAMNLGGLLGALVYGFIIEFFGWSASFYLNIVLFIIITSVIAFNHNIKRFHQTTKPLLKPLIIIGLLILILFCCFYFIKLSYWLIGSIWLIIVLSFIIYLRRQNKAIQKHLYLILLLNTCCVFFFSCSFQVASSITLFIQREVHRQIAGLTIPTSSFSALDPLFVVLMAPIFVWLWQHLAKRNIIPKVTTKIAIGILLAGLSFVLLFFIAQHTQQQTLTLIGIVIANLLLGAGEICVSPAVLSAINDYAPVNLQSTMVGSWFMFIAIAGIVAGQLAQLSDVNAVRHISIVHDYSHAFIWIAIFAMVSAAVVYCLRGIVAKLI